ncbi:MAG: AbiV family abortive infection protein [archaeon]|nr:AbiV family abortive infection protein [archaeon]MCP8314678.1 AbiV family abortive infection protein [archaeon]
MVTKVSKVKELSLEEIELGRAKALANARALIEDAEILFAAGRYPRSFAMAHLACEELGKVIMLASIGIQIRLGRANWKKFWRRFRSHKEKTKNILGLDYPGVSH